MHVPLRGVWVIHALMARRGVCMGTCGDCPRFCATGRFGHGQVTLSPVHGAPARRIGVVLVEHMQQARAWVLEHTLRSAGTHKQY